MTCLSENFSHCAVAKDVAPPEGNVSAYFHKTQNFAIRIFRNKNFLSIGSILFDLSSLLIQWLGISPKQLCTLVPDKPTELVCRPTLMCMPCPTCKNVSKFGHKIGSLKGHPWVAFFCFLWYNSLIIPLSNATWFGSLFLLVPKLHGFKGSRGQSVWIWPRWELKS